MALTFTGTATVATVNGTLSAPAIASNWKTTDATLKVSHNITMLNDGAGNIKGFMQSAHGEISLDLTLVIRASTTTVAANSLQLPTVNSKVTLTNFPSPAGDTGMFNADWHYRDGASVTFGSENEAKITLTVYRYPGNSDSVDTLTTAVA